MSNNDLIETGIIKEMHVMQKRVIVLCLLVVLLFSIPGIEAVAEEIPGIESAVKTEAEEPLLCIPTIDNQRYQLSIRLIDFKSSQEINAALVDASGNHDKKSLPGLLTSFLGDVGYPMNQEGISIAPLFDGSIEVNNFFPESDDGHVL